MVNTIYLFSNSSQKYQLYFAKATKTAKRYKKHSNSNKLHESFVEMNH